MTTPVMLVVVSGPSGVGKGTVIAESRRIRPDIELCVSMTTRPPRPGEVDGVNYHFVTRREFKSKIAAGEMLEFAEFSGHLYGTPRADVVDAMRRDATVMLEIELEGARQVKRSFPKALTVMVCPPSMFELASRLRDRGTEDVDEVDQRLQVAERELAAVDEFDARLVNTDVHETAVALLELLDTAAR